MGSLGLMSRQGTPAPTAPTAPTEKPAPPLSSLNGLVSQPVPQAGHVSALRTTPAPFEKIIQLRITKSKEYWLMFFPL